MLSGEQPRSAGAVPSETCRMWRLPSGRVSVVPVTGPAVLRAAEPPRAGSVEFTDGSRTVALPIRAALPVLVRARRDGADGGDGDVHPSVGLLAEAGVLALRLVGAGRFAPGDGAWRLAPLEEAEDEQVRRLAADPSYDAAYDSPADAEAAVRAVLAAVVDALPRGTPSAGGGDRLRSPAACRARRAAALQDAAGAGDDLAARRGRRGGAGRRVGAAGGAGARRARPTPPVRCGRAVGRLAGGPRVRRAGAHPRRDRPERRGSGLAGARPPAGAEGARRDHPRHRRPGLAARRGCRRVATGRRRRAVAAQPRPRPDHAGEPRAPRRSAGEPAHDRPVRAAGDVRVPLAGGPARRPALRRRDGRAGRHRVTDPQAARQLDGRRPRHRPQGQAPPDPDRQPGPGRRRRADGHRRGRGQRAGGRGRRQPAQGPRAAAVGADPHAARPARRPEGDAARLSTARPDLARPADGARPRLLPGRRHGARQDRDADRAAPAPARDDTRRIRPADAGGLPDLAARQLGGRDRAVRSRHSGPAVPRLAALPRRPRAATGATEATPASC